MAVAVHGGGGLPQCMLGYPLQVWAWRPPLARPLNFPPGCGPGDPPWRPARHAGITPAMHAEIPPPPPRGWNDRHM